MLNAADVTFDVLWRDASGTDHAIASATHHFDPQPSGFDAVPFETDVAGVKADARGNDRLVLRFTATPSTPPVTANEIYYVPNSDGANAMGKIPSLTLPK